MIVKPIKTRIFNENEDLISFIKTHINKLKKNSVLVITSKIVALAEGRTVVVANKKEKDAIMRKESKAVIKTKIVNLTLKDGMLMAGAGIDASNANGKLVLLPRDSFKVANELHQKLKKIYKIKNLGIIITDSRTFPLRAGVIGVTTGFAGFKGIRDYRGRPDIFGRKMQFSRTNNADCLATAAVFLMGEADETCPLAIIEGAPLEFIDQKTRRNALSISIESDMYKPLLMPLIRKIKMG
ncbi:MAG: coenzyme F420-0:L-glutamate ligase [Patescibacteria group bacterium]